MELLRLLETSCPASLRARLRILWTRGTHPPHPVPAFVQAFSPARSLHLTDLTVSTMSPFVTL